MTSKTPTALPGQLRKAEGITDIQSHLALRLVTFPPEPDLGLRREKLHRRGGPDTSPEVARNHQPTAQATVLFQAQGLPHRTGRCVSDHDTGSLCGWSMCRRGRQAFFVSTHPVPPRVVLRPSGRPRATPACRPQGSAL